MKKNSKIDEHSVGIVTPQYFTFAEEPESFEFLCGRKLSPITLAYETYGTLNRKRDNAVLICHALSGNAHAAGYHHEDDPYPGWWDAYIGPGKAFDTDKHYIICSNVIGGCDGSTGPSTINPATGRPYGLSFPMITVRDIVQAQRHLIRHLGINSLQAVAGGSLGGMQALKWAILYPGMVRCVIAIATSASVSAQAIAFNEVGRQAIFKDPSWNNGDYYDRHSPDSGLSLARMIGHITYMSEKLMHEKFGRRLQDSAVSHFDFDQEFLVETYLHHQGFKFVNRFDANSYIYITKAIDYFDLGKDYEGMISAFEHVSADFLVVSFTSDWLYPSTQVKEIVKALRVNGKNVVYTDIDTDKGHDAFLVKNRPLERNIANFLKSHSIKDDELD
ncbi:MAG TPA: homoserine O-acetyltransferase [Spirochaetota bacterium]|nr:homoserine O-acetyltransferase [Spirochaetota bacterium]HPI89757.1 homoserine O-acetyltransferase [Spirochaetota bacterium]HPR47586.1 homoserine O-acetyltransferase [Spirochaetota bacterium]